MCHGLELARSFIFRGNCSSFLTQSHIHPKPFAEPDTPPGRQSIENNLPLPTGDQPDIKTFEYSLPVYDDADSTIEGYGAQEGRHTPYHWIGAG